MNKGSQRSSSSSSEAPSLHSLLMRPVEARPADRRAHLLSVLNEALEISQSFEHNLEDATDRRMMDVVAPSQ